MKVWVLEGRYSRDKWKPLDAYVDRDSARHAAWQARNGELFYMPYVSYRVRPYFSEPK